MTSYKRGIVFLATIFGLFVFVAAPTYAGGSDKKVALIIALGGLGDRSYNDSGFAGLTKAAQDFGVQVVPIESPDPLGEGEQLLRSAAEAGFDLVITLEYSHFDPLPRVAVDYPDTMFSIINVVVEGPNIVSVLFDEHTGSFLAGALAAMVTTDESIEQTNNEAILGAIGGVPASGIDVFLYGYLQGACAVNPDIKVLFAYSNSFADPARGREITLAMYEQGADIVFSVAGGTGSGIIEAAKEKNRFAIGVDSDQDYIAPGNVLTSMLKRVDIAVYDMIRQLVEGTLVGGTVPQYGLAIDGVGITEMTYTRHLIPAAYVDKVDGFRQSIISGDIDVIDVRTLKEDHLSFISSNPTCEGFDQLRGMLGQ
jgi:basic membrane protein A